MNETEKRIENTLKRIGIDYAANTKQAITKIIGEEPQASVLDDLVRKHFLVLENAKNQPQGYRYGILKKLLQTEYHGLKLKLEAERAEQERMREEQKKYPPSVLEDCYRRAAESRHEEGIGDISELLDDWGEEDEELYAHQEPSVPSTLQQVLAEAKRQKKAELFGWEDDDDDDEL